MSSTIRQASLEDLPAIAGIYAREVLTGTSTFDLEPPPQAYWEAKLASQEPGDHLLVAGAGAAGVTGFAYSTSYRPRGGYRHTRETSIYLAPAARGQGLGRRLYDDLLATMAVDGVHTVLALVARPNPASEALHVATGFRQVGTMTEVGRKLGRWIDTVWYERRLG